MRDLRGIRAAALAGGLLAAVACGAPAEPPAEIPEPTGTQRMVERLARLAAEPGINPTIGAAARVEQARRRLAATTDLRQRVIGTKMLGYRQLLAGENLAAIESFRLAERLVAEAGLPDDPRSRRQAADLLATAQLRLGEQDNCIALHGPESCLFPIEGSGIHAEQRGSRAAIETLSAALDARPDDVAFRWLLNVAFMTVGEYPAGVPARWLIPPETFASDHDPGRFANVAGPAGVDVRGLSGGVALEDFDGDGLIDLMTSAWGLDEPLRYFRNTGDGRFEERTEAAGLAGLYGGLNMVHADYDNDGHADVFVLRGAWLNEHGTYPNSLLRNRGDGAFEDVTEQAGVLSFHPTQTAAWADFDNDGLLDLFVGNESKGSSVHPCELYRNDGDGTFTEVASSVGVANVGFVKGAVWGDYDGDGWQDLYLSRFDAPNVLYRSVPATGGGRRFRDVTDEAGVAEPRRSFPTWFFDYDDDGRLDLFVAPFPGFAGDYLAPVVSDYLGLPVDAGRPRLYRNLGDGSFEELSVQLGLDDVLLAMGSNFGDLDNDGWLDVYIGTGEPNLHTLVPNRMYRNDAGRGFQDVTTAAGVGHLQKGHAVAFADLDNDGDQEIYANMGGAYASDVAYNALFENPGHGHRWVTLRLEGRRANRSAIGARLTLTVEGPDGERSLHRRVGTGGSFGSSSLQQEIGLGDATRIVGLEVAWPGGARERVEGLAPDGAYVIVEGTGRGEPLELPRFRFGGR